MPVVAEMPRSKIQWPVTRSKVTNTLVVLAHSDDEYFVSARIRAETQAGNSVYVVFTTYGSLYGASTEARIEESRIALGRLGVPPDRILFMGLETGCFDGKAVENLD